MEDKTVFSLSQMTVLNNPYVYMKNAGEVENKIRKLVTGGSQFLQIITDFDRTLTKDNVNGVPTKSSYCIFELCKELPDSFRNESKVLLDKYHPIEIDHNLSVEEKLPYMVEWWKQGELLLSGLKIEKSAIDRAVSEANVEFRDGCGDMFKMLNNKSVPVLVFSAGLGDVISSVLNFKSYNFPNIHVISNFLQFNGSEIVGFHGPIIHVFNKNEQAVKNSEYFNEVKDRKNILLMGDSLGDSNMAEGVPQQANVLKIGFLTSKHNNEYLPQYMDNFDIVLVDDQTMEIPIAILNCVL